MTCAPISTCQLPLSASTSSTLAADRDLGAQAGTKLVRVRHGMEAHHYPRLHEGNCQQGKGGDPSTLLCTILVNHSWTEPGSAQQHPVTGQEAMGRHWIW